jgi:hypothetical protein
MCLRLLAQPGSQRRKVLRPSRRAYLELGALEAQANMSQVSAGGLEDESVLPEGGEDEEVIDMSLSSPYIWGKLHADSEDDNE